MNRENETKAVTSLTSLTYEQMLALLQMTSPALPIGSYTYSEGVEWLVEAGVIWNDESLKSWILEELKMGSTRLEAGILLRCFRSAMGGDPQGLRRWNLWFLATRETSELRQQTCQTGYSLLQLLQSLGLLSEPWQAVLQPSVTLPAAFGLGSSRLGIPEAAMLLGYLHSWITHMIHAGIRLGVLGQTQGQIVLQACQDPIGSICGKILRDPDEDLGCFSLGQTLASMAHETQYSRLFRS